MDTKPVILNFNLQQLAKRNLSWTIILSLLFVLLNGLIHQRFEFHFSVRLLFLFIFLYFIFIVLHEICHLIGFVVFGKVQLRQLKYGMNLKLGVAYATTSKPVTNRAMKATLLLPFWITGVIPALIGFYTNNHLILLLGAFLIAGAVGDFSMYYALKKFPNDALVQDDPLEPKLYVYK